MAERSIDMVTRELRDALATRSGTSADDWFPVFKARYGMEVVFRSLSAGRSVITQLFTCCTAVDPIVAAGLKPVYAEVSPINLMVDAARLGPLGGAAAIMMQHTFGIVDEAASRDLAERAHASSALLVEDSAHCVCRMARDEDGAPLADVSVHSFGVEKMLPTHFGGAIWINPRMRDARLSHAMRETLSSLPVPDGRLDRATRGYLNQNRILNRMPAAAASAARERLVSRGRLEPAIASVELRGGLAYEPMLPTEWICRQVTGALGSLEANEAARREIVEVYREGLSGLAGIELPAAISGGESQPLLRLPLFAGDTASAEAIISGVRRSGAFAERWYRPALFPGVEVPEAYGLGSGPGLPITEDLIARVACLPTELSREQAGRAIEAVVEAIG